MYNFMPIIIRYLNDTKKFLKKHKLPKHIQEEIGHIIMNSLVSNKEIEFVV